MACLVPGWIFEPSSCFHLDTLPLFFPFDLHSSLIVVTHLGLFVSCHAPKAAP
jgi:hypothetical protein